LKEAFRPWDWNQGSKGVFGVVMEEKKKKKKISLIDPACAAVMEEDNILEDIWINIGLVHVRGRGLRLVESENGVQGIRVGGGDNHNA